MKSSNPLSHNNNRKIKSHSAGFKPVSPKVDFPELERRLLEKWYKEGIITKYLHKNNNSKKRFSFLDGPITANNPMGVHHAWGRTYKDLWQRFWNMRGYQERFQNGFDEQGLWVEVEVEKELGLKNKKDIENLVFGDKFKSLEKFINLCKERVKKYSTIQTEQSKRLGYFMDWENSYHTSSDQNNYAIWNFLKVVNEKGWLYKGRDSVPWCPRCGTAISQHEILTEEYKELIHKTVVFKLPIERRKKEYLLAWTTTPWTIPGNAALAVDPNLSYWKMSNEKGEKIIIINPTASGDLNKEAMLVNKLNLTDGWVKVEELKGKDLINLEYEAPYDNLPAIRKALGNYSHRVVSSDPRILMVNPAEGTGIVHIAPGAGGEDFKLGKKEQIPAIEEIDESGLFLEGYDFLSGLHVKKAIVEILADLKRRNFIHKTFDYTHRYPTCWRCKTELVWRVVDEWYIAMDKPESSKLKTYREQMIEVAKKINWIPSWGLERELDWLDNMHDWLISKKRYWGLSLPIWECHKCKKFSVIGSYEELKEKTVQGWEVFEGNSPHRPWIDEVKIKCEECGEIVSRIPDVGNPWLDAGIVPFSTMSSDWFPADFITESFPGQFKNWFYSLIAMSTALKNQLPFKNLLGFATMVDEKGEAFHKSKGNAIEFVEGADKAGADVIRWVCLTASPQQNVLFGYHIADETRRRFHLMLWNVYNFFVTYANIDQWEVKSQKSKVKSQNTLDRWILSRLHTTIEKVTQSLEKYEADIASSEIEDFVRDLSLWYVRRSRDRVGLVAEDNKDKNECYRTLYAILTTLARLLSPFTPFLAEEIYTNLTKEESIHLSDWPDVEISLIDHKLEKAMENGIILSSSIHAFRKYSNIKVRIPLKTLYYTGPIELRGEIEKIVLDEINVYKLIYKGESEKYDVYGKTNNQNQDLLAGKARDIIRQIQEERKKLGTRLDEKVKVILTDWPRELEEEIKKKALVSSITKGDKFSVRKA